MEIRERKRDYKNITEKLQKIKKVLKEKVTKIRLISWEKKEKIIKTIKYKRRKKDIKKTKEQFIVNVKKIERRNLRKENK